MYQQIFEEIIKFDNIAILRHISPDGDAVFSQFGLTNYIRENFPNKKVKALGNDLCDLYPCVDKEEDLDLNNLLVIVCDTSIYDRIDGKEYISIAKKTIKIDHHPIVDNFGDINIVESNRSSTCELIANILLSWDEFTLSKLTAETLFKGILTDSISFKTSNTSYTTFEIAYKLAKIGINISKIQLSVFQKDIKEYNLITKLRNYLKIDGSLGYVILENDELSKLGLDEKTAKQYVNVFADIKGINVWGIIVFNNKTNMYDGSLRSIDGYVVNQIASIYNGGGHVCAAGFKNVKQSELFELINKLKEEANK